MDLETLLKTKEFLDELSVSIRNIILASFPGLTAEEREDVDHEVKLKLWRKVARGKKIINLRSYLWRVVYTTALDLVSGNKHTLPLDKVLETAEEEGKLPDVLLTPDESWEARELVLRLKKALDVLPERRKAVAKLHFAGLTIPQIAGLLGWRENQVRHLLYRGLADVRDVLSAERTASISEPTPVPSTAAIKRG
jgi:RNA polymerase sigma factor (sigma-70 family)